MHRLLRVLVLFTALGCTNGVFRGGGSGTNEPPSTFPRRINNEVYAILARSGGELFVAGAFTTVNGVATNRFVSLLDTGATDASFDVQDGFNAPVRSIYFGPTDSAVVVGGDFTTYQGASEGHIIRLDLTGNKDSIFDAGVGFNATVRSIIRTNNGGATSPRYIVGGDFTTYKGLSQMSLASIDTTDGTIDADINAAFNGPVHVLEDIGSEQFLVGGSFASPKQNLLALKADGTDPFTSISTPNGTSGPVYGLQDNSFNDAYVGGDFSTYNGGLVDRFMNMTYSTGNASGFGTKVNGPCYTVEYSGSAYVLGGNFSQYDPGTGFETHGNIVSTGVTGTISPGWNSGTGFNGPVYTVHFASVEGKYYVGGAFTRYNGVDVSPIVRLELNGTLDATFLPE